MGLSTSCCGFPQKLQKTVLLFCDIFIPHLERLASGLARPTKNINNLAKPLAYVTMSAEQWWQIEDVAGQANFWKQSPLDAGLFGFLD